MRLLCTVAVIPLDEHDLLCHETALFNGAKAEDISEPRIGLLVAVCNTHTTSYSHVEPSKFTLGVHDGDETEVIGENIYIVRGWHSNSNFELVRMRTILDSLQKRPYLARKIEFAVQRLKVFQSFSSHKFLVQPDLMVCGRSRKKMLANLLGELVYLGVKFGKRRYRRANDIPTQGISIRSKLS